MNVQNHLTNFNKWLRCQRKNMVNLQFVTKIPFLLTHI